MAKTLHINMLFYDSKEARCNSDAVLRKDVLGGEGKMQPVKLIDDEMNDVPAFIRTLAKRM